VTARRILSKSYRTSPASGLRRFEVGTQLRAAAVHGYGM